MSFTKLSNNITNNISNIKKITNITCDNKINDNYSFFVDKMNHLKYKKNMIDLIENSIHWDKSKRNANPYELIHVIKNRNKSIANYMPLSRSYFKMIELINKFDIFKHCDKDIYIANLAEGPGGFMEAIYNYRKSLGFKNDKLFGITLESDNKIPNWIQFKNKIKKLNTNNINIYYGNLYNFYNICEYCSNFSEKKAYLVTADGGLDYSGDYNNQEKDSYRIIFCEIITNLIIQKKGGVFICKMFDIFTLFSLKIIYILYCLYDELYIEKLMTSRPANSEKYIIAKGYKGINSKLLCSFFNIIIYWNKNIVDINEITLPPEFIKEIKIFNDNYVDKQIYYITKTYNLANKKMNKKIHDALIFKQVKNAVSWCKKFNVDINTKSIYYKKYYANKL